jgi:hypothetical protein
VLNTWHLTQYQRYNDQLRARLLAELSTVPSCGNAVTSSHPDAKHTHVPLPRILVCAPSNAATDELLNRVLHKKFVDVHGDRYTPQVVRVGSDSAQLSSEAQEVRSCAASPQYPLANHAKCIPPMQRWLSAPACLGLAPRSCSRHRCLWQPLRSPPR